MQYTRTVKWRVGGFKQGFIKEVKEVSGFNSVAELDSSPVVTREVMSCLVVYGVRGQARLQNKRKNTKLRKSYILFLWTFSWPNTILPKPAWHDMTCSESLQWWLTSTVLSSPSFLDPSWKHTMSNCSVGMRNESIMITFTMPSRWYEFFSLSTINQEIQCISHQPTNILITAPTCQL